MAHHSALVRRLAWVALLGGVLPTAGAAVALLMGAGPLRDWAQAHPGWQVAAALALCGLAVLGGAAAIRLGRRVTGALDALNAQAEAVARGDLTGRVETRGGRVGEGCRDELDRVATAFNLMTAQLAQQIVERDRYEGELRALNVELEQRVAQRTADLEEAQRQLLRSEKSAALGQLVAGIAHEINNHVNFITTAIHPVEMGIADLRSALDAWRHAAEATLDEIRPVIERAQAEEQEIGTELVLEELATALGQMRGGAQRIRTIVTNLRTFSHSGGERPEAVDLAQLIDQTVALVTPRLGEGIEVKLDLDPLAPVTCLPVQMSQVLVNLLLNAADAIGREGTIAVHLWREGDEVRLSVQDDGHGIPPELQSKIFDPFYTTKDVGEGTGLGLYVCQQILASHGGGIEVESIPGEGTEMTLHWPAEANALKKTATA